MVDYLGAYVLLVDEQRVFIDQNDHTWVVIHKTASGGSAQDIATFFANDPAMASTHYVVGQDGTIVQCVLEKDGAAGNCCLETGHALYLPEGVNLNTKTVSIEHVDPATDNSTPLTDAQKAASFHLVHDICVRHNIPMRPGDASGGIIGHSDIAPINRARCPGNYPWSELFAFLSTPGPAPERNPHMDTQAQDVWNMFLKGIGQTPVSYTTGIAQSWQQNYLHVNAGSPLGPEQKTVDWNGTDIQMQLFSGGISAEYNTQDHVVRWYDAYHKQVA